MVQKCNRQCFLLQATIALFIIVVLQACKTSRSNKPQADFDYNKSGCDTGCIIQFQNKSQNATAFLWEFGDSTTSTDENPNKKYAFNGIHLVTLTAKNADGKASVSKSISSEAPKPVLAILPLVADLQLPDSIRDKMDETKLSNVTHPIYLPANCENGFAICNVGEKGSKLKYSIIDVDGYYNFNDPAGMINAGEGIYIHVKAKSAIWYGTSSLNVTSENATNGKNFFVPFPRRSMLEEGKNMLGIWRGTWNGKSYGAANPSEPSPTASVNGTWTLEIKSIDTADSSATGTFTWNGNDAYWVYDVDGMGKITKATATAFPTNITIPLDKNNFRIILPGAGGPCHQYRILINDQIQGSSYGKYGPKFRLDVNLVSNNTAQGGWADYVAWPYAPTNTGNLSTNQSNGTVTGKKD